MSSLVTIYQLTKMRSLKICILAHWKSKHICSKLRAVINSILASLLRSTSTGLWRRASNIFTLLQHCLCQNIVPHKRIQVFGEDSLRSPSKICTSSLPSSLPVNIDPGPSTLQRSENLLEMSDLSTETIQNDVQGPSPELSTAGNTEMCIPTSRSSSHIETTPESCSLGPQFYPIPPSLFERYERPDTVPPTLINFEIPRGSIVFANELSGGWKSYLHPEGARYFCLEHDLFTVCTDADLHNKEISRSTQDFLTQAVDYIQKHKHDLQIDFQTEFVDLVLDITMAEGGGFVCGYYFVHHPNRVVFWTDDYPASAMLWGSIEGVTSKAHILHELQSQYWKHRALFPCAQPLSKTVVDELRDILVHSIADSIVSSTPIIPYSTEEMESLLALLQVEIPSEQLKLGGFARTVYRLMGTFAHDRFLHFHGEPAARLESGKSVYPQPTFSKAQSHWFYLVSFIFFHAPHQHLSNLEGIFSDRLLSQPQWKTFKGKLIAEWTDLTLYSTVLLNANVAFLSIQSINISPPVRTGIYISTAASLGSVVIGLLLLRRTRSVDPNFPHHLESLTRFRRLALLHSLPYAFLMWGTVTFSLSFCVTCILNTSAWIWAISTAMWMFLFATVVFYILVFQDHDFSFSEIRQRLVDATRIRLEIAQHRWNEMLCLKSGALNCFRRRIRKSTT